MSSFQPYIRNVLTKFNISHHLLLNNVPKRSFSYYSSKFLVDVEANTKYETTRNPEDWKYVARILPPVLVPEPQKLVEYKSGWKPPAEDFSGRPYFIPRTKNHMMPVYLQVMQRGIKRHTIIRKIQGDIWQFEKDLRPYLEDLIKPKPLRLQVNEFARKICINGDHVNAIKYWLSERNF